MAVLGASATGASHRTQPARLHLVLTGRKNTPTLERLVAGSGWLPVFADDRLIQKKPSDSEGFDNVERGEPKRVWGRTLAVADGLG